MDRNGWRKSSYSGTGNCAEIGWQKSSFCNGGACLEWQKSSFCASGECVEAACGHPRAGVRVRDSALAGSPVLAFAPATWARFLAEVKAAS